MLYTDSESSTQLHNDDLSWMTKERNYTTMESYTFRNVAKHDDYVHMWSIIDVAVVDNRSQPIIEDLD